MPDCCSRVTLCDTVVRRAPVARVALAFLGDSSRKSLLEKDVGRETLACVRGKKKQKKKQNEKDPLRDKHIFTLSLGSSLAAERCTVSATPQPRNASTFISGF